MAEQDTQESPLVVDAVDNVSRGIADHYLIRESLGFFEKGENLVLDTARKLRVHDGQKLVLKDTDTGKASKIADTDDIVEGLFSLDNKLLVCIINGKFWHFDESENKFLVLDKQLFPPNSSKTNARRFQMVAHNGLFLFVCSDYYYRPVSILIKYRYDLENDGVIKTEIDGHYFGVPDLAKRGVIPVGGAKPTEDQEKTELYDYLFCLVKKFKIEKTTFMHYGPLFSVDGVLPKEETLDIANADKFKSGGVHLALKKSSLPLNKKAGGVRPRFYYFRHNAIEIIVYISAELETTKETTKETTYSYLQRDTNVTTKWDTGADMYVLSDPGAFSDVDKKTAVSSVKGSYVTIKTDSSVVAADDEKLRRRDIGGMIVDKGGNQGLFLYVTDVDGITRYLATIQLHKGGGFSQVVALSTGKMSIREAADNKTLVINAFPVTKVLWFDLSADIWRYYDRFIFVKQYHNTTTSDFRYTCHTQTVNGIYKYYPLVLADAQSPVTYSLTALGRSEISYLTPGFSHKVKARVIRSGLQDHEGSSTYHTRFAAFCAIPRNVGGADYSLNNTDIYLITRRSSKHSYRRSGSGHSKGLYMTSYNFSLISSAKKNKKSLVNFENTNLPYEFFLMPYLEETIGSGNRKEVKYSSRSRSDSIYTYPHETYGKWEVTGVEAFFGTSTVGGDGFYWVAYNHTISDGRTSSGYTLQRHTIKDHTADVRGNIQTYKLMIPDTRYPQKIVLPTIPDMKYSWTIEGTASRGSVLYVLARTNNVDGDKKTHIRVFIYHITSDHNRSLLHTIEDYPVANYTLRHTIKIGVTWSHIYIIMPTPGRDECVFKAWNRYTFERDTHADYTMAGVAPNVVLGNMGGVYLAPNALYYATGTKFVNKIKYGVTDVGYRQYPYSPDRIKMLFYDISKPEAILDNTQHETNAESYPIIGIGQQANADNILSVHNVCGLYTIQKYIILLYIKPSTITTTQSCVAIYSRTEDKIYFLLAPPPDDTKGEIYNFTNIFISEPYGYNLYVWKETKKTAGSTTTYINTIDVYKVADLVVNIARVANDWKNYRAALLRGDDKNDVVKPTYPAPLEKTAELEFKFPKHDKDMLKYYGAEKSYLWDKMTLEARQEAYKKECALWGEMDIEAYRKDPDGEEYKKVTTVPRIDLADEMVVTDTDFPTASGTGTPYTALAGYDGDKIFGLPTPPRAKQLAVSQGRVILADVKENKIILGAVSEDTDDAGFIKTRKLMYSSAIGSNGFPIGNRVYFPHDITYVGGYRSRILAAGAFNIYRLNSNFTVSELNSVVGIVDSRNAAVLHGMFIFVSKDGIYATDGFNIFKINTHLDEYFKKNIQDKETQLLYFALKRKVYVFYKNHNSDKYFSKGLILDLVHSNMKASDGAFCTEYLENSLLCPQEKLLLGVSWVVHKNVMYKANTNGTFCKYDETTKEKEINFSSTNDTIIKIPTGYQFISGGLAFQSSWRKKHIYSMSCTLDVKQGGSVHLFSIGEGGKSRVDLKDIFVPIIGELDDDTTSVDNLLLQRSGIISNTQRLGGQLRDNIIYQVGFENGLTLEHSGGSGQWDSSEQATYRWDGNNWNYHRKQNKFSKIAVNNLVPSRPRRFHSHFPFLNYLVIFKNIVDKAPRPYLDTIEKRFGSNGLRTYVSKLQLVFGQIIRQRFLLTDDIYLGLNSNGTLRDIANFGIKKNLSDFINLQLYSSINDHNLFDPTPFFVDNSETLNPPLTPTLVQWYNPTSGPISSYIGPFTFDFDLYTYSTMDFQLLSLTVTGGQGPSPNPAEQSNST